MSITSLDIFRLGYILSHSMCEVLVHIKPFLASVLILYSLKAPGNQKPFSIFRRFNMRTKSRNGLIKFVVPR